MGRHRLTTVSKRKRGATESWHLVWPLVFPAPSWHLREPSDAPGGQQGSRKGGSGLFCTWWLPAALCLCFPGTPSISSPLSGKDLGDVSQQDEGEGKGKRAKAKRSGGNGVSFLGSGLFYPHAAWSWASYLASLSLHSTSSFLYLIFV